MYSIIRTAARTLLLVFVCVVHAGQDPMRPPNWTNQAPRSPSTSARIDLQQILISKDRKIVIVNDKILQEGQLIDGYKIIEIDAKQIKIRRAGVNKIIKLLPITKGENREI